jgi:predicted MFS family arabinose efflux permease
MTSPCAGVQHHCARDLFLTCQVAIGRTLAGAMTGNLLGASASGLIGDFLGWRGVLAVLGTLVVLASIAVAAGFHGAALTRAPKTNLSGLKQGYRIFSNPNARICYSAVFIEGCCVLGLFPFIASFLFELGETSLSIAGIVIAGFAVGGLLYTATVSRFLPRLGVNGMMIAGATLVGVQLIAVAFGPGWKLQTLSLMMMGWGFYMIHGCLQVFASELSVEARATALSLHSFFFFMGQTIGPIAYGFGILNVGKRPTLLASGVIIVALGFACARLLRQSKPAAQRRSRRRQSDGLLTDAGYFFLSSGFCRESRPDANGDLLSSLCRCWACFRRRGRGACA